MTRIGLISDTHGLLRPEVRAALQGCVHIVHAGDIGDARVLEELDRLAPVTAVRGNNDHGHWTKRIAHTELVQVAGLWIYAVHEIDHLDIDPRAADVHVVVTGHSHRPKIVERDGVLFVNPGSAGPRRFSLPVTIADLVLTPEGPRATIVPLLNP